MLVAPPLLRERKNERVRSSGSPLEIPGLLGLVFRVAPKDWTALLLVLPGGVTSTTSLLQGVPLVRLVQTSLDCGPVVPVCGTTGPLLRTAPLLSKGPLTATLAVRGLRSSLQGS